MHCYCSICRKTAGGGGSAINILGEAQTLEVEGKEQVSVYQARGTGRDADARSSARRHFCKLCGSALYISDPRWPDWVYPHASAIDTPLPEPQERLHIMLASKPSWVRLPVGSGEERVREYPNESIEAWHRARGLLQE